MLAAFAGAPLLLPYPSCGGCFVESALIACFLENPVIPLNLFSLCSRSFFVRIAAERLRMIPKQMSFSNFDISIIPLLAS